MSEFEKQQRSNYQQKRNKHILIQKIILAVLCLCLLVSALLYLRFDKSTYVYYQEEGNAIHRAYLAENEFYSEKYLNGSHAYVSSLIEKMTADFSYHLVFDTDEVNFRYNYRIDAQLEIKDKASGAPLYNPIDEILPLKEASSSGNELCVEELVEFDFQAYNAKAVAYLEEFNLKDTVNTLILRMYVNVVGESEAFASDRSGEYITELRVPLTKVAFKPEVSTTVPAGEQKILAIDENYKTTFLILAITFGILVLIDIAVLICYVILTRDKHIDYRRRVDAILRNYKSYIQRTTTCFDLGGYNVLRLESINELLDIHDTLRKPILAHENEDCTCARFFIVADFNLAYLYEVTVAGMDTTPFDDGTDPDGNNDRGSTVPEADDEPAAENAEQSVEAGAAEIENVALADDIVGEGVEVVTVRFPETDTDYKYDPNGEKLQVGDVVLVPTTNSQGIEFECEATVSRENHKVSQSSLKHSLKKIIRVVARAAASVEEENTTDATDNN